MLLLFYFFDTNFVSGISISMLITLVAGLDPDLAQSKMKTGNAKSQRLGNL